MPNDVVPCPQCHARSAAYLVVVQPDEIPLLRDAPHAGIWCRRCGTVYDPIPPATSRVLGTYWRVGY
ncbi:hypothetical protein SAMN00768000_0228 [Sulfobacillus thermosulfidooxidans DSM 9293]|uniref:Uncharacterized protein n=1 Tax=Sulfobacillus thermosulfidooxidans (strain DSM 9293 / VKM B-1269 / AT-1) TaxID=929705 RepID=A0A1W1W7B4_SULTA|nr:hypothetical protein [Sulfobacillus thermosulfidooxidans]SMC02019.1 hypothetical protein SAMN00768000_0228 [Sulfobacillus thermosulfidooxidans DSM 9293]